MIGLFLRWCCKHLRSMQELRHAWKAVETARGGPWGHQINTNVSTNDNT